MAARSPATLALLAAAVGALAVAMRAAAAPERYSYSLEYQVIVSDRDPRVARVRWKLAGIDEIEYLRFDLRGHRISDVSGTGRLEERGDELRWTPGGPYAHLEYRVPLRHRRDEDEGYDSYATEDWAITRAKVLFPRVQTSVNHVIEPDPNPRCRLVFRLPKGWTAYTAMAEIAPGVFVPPATDRHLDRPKGWFALGRNLDVVRRRIDGTEVTVARAPGSRWNSEGVLDLYERALPTLAALLGNRTERLLIVSGPDPMWRGGISGEASYYVHGKRPLRTPDRTSPPLHELFHILAPFRPGRDGEWISEGLAEYYSLAIPHRLGLLTDREFERGLGLFRRYGDWNVNLAERRDLAATNNSAPLVVHAIDRAVRTRTDGERSLDDVVREISRSGGSISTAAFLRAVNRVSGHNFTPFFQRHVYAGVPPADDDATKRPRRSAAEAPSG